MRLIDADYLNNNLFRNCPIEEGGIPLPDFATHIKILGFYPTVDAVEVVRCKDCKWLWKEKMLCIHPKHCDGMVAVCECDKDGFCSYGERKIKDVHKCP